MVELDLQQVVEVSGGMRKLPGALYPTSMTGPALYVDGMFWGYLNP